MIKNLPQVFIVLFLNLIVGCSTEKDHLKIDVFTNQKINFDSELVMSSSDFLIRDNGRVIF